MSWLESGRPSSVGTRRLHELLERRVEVDVDTAQQRHLEQDALKATQANVIHRARAELIAEDLRAQIPHVDNRELPQTYHVISCEAAKKYNN